MKEPALMTKKKHENIDFVVLAYRIPCKDDDDEGKGAAEGKEERTSILIHSLTPDHPPLAAITGNN